MSSEKKVKSVFILIGFIISVYCTIIIISSSYTLYKSSAQENHFNSKYTLMQVQLNDKERLDMPSFIQELSDVGINEVFTRNMANNIDKGEYIAATDVVATNYKINLDEFGKIAGRNLEEEELGNGEKVAIVGEGAIKNIIEDNGDKYIKVFDEYYKVVGEIKGNEFLKYNIIVPIKSMPFYNNKYNVFNYLIDDSEVGKLNNLNSKYNFKVNKTPKIDIKKELFQKLPEAKEFLYSLCLAIINMILFSVLFAKDLKRDLAIMRMLGAKNIHIIKLILIKIINLVLMAIPVSLIMSNLTINYINIKVINSFSKLNFEIIALSISITVIIMIIVVVVMCFNTLKFKVIKAIR